MDREDLHERNRRFDAEMGAAREAWIGVWEEWGSIMAAIATLVLALTLGGCAYMDAAHAVKEEGKARLAVLNDHYADDVADLARTVPAGALARLPAGPQKCSLAALAGLQLVECQFVAMPGWSRAP